MKIPELRSRIIFTALILAVARLIAMVPVPGLDAAELSRYAESAAQRAGGAGGVVAIYSLFTGGALEKCAVGSLGIMPYISASIIIQLLTAVVPMLGKLAREEGGRVKLIAYGRYLTVLLCIGWATVTALSWENPESAFKGFSGKLITMDNLWVYRFQTVIILTTGTLLLMWLGEQISERGVGNGVSLVITIGILARLPMAAKSLWALFFPPVTSDVSAGVRWPTAFVLVALLVAVIAAVIAITQAQRKIPVQYAQRAVGRKVVSGGTSYMPLKVNYPGVMPVIFAQSILMFPGMFLQKLYSVLSPGFLRDDI
ncbi:MAG TPA: preprotein translocase subunit SecY, partial [Candidatus Limnocylindria bacterium]|nr:preprotein translocase subunit SecY [Candidatus Limnocylindria bacterium]